MSSSAAAGNGWMLLVLGSRRSSSPACSRIRTRDRQRGRKKAATPFSFHEKQQGSLPLLLLLLLLLMMMEGAIKSGRGNIKLFFSFLPDGCQESLIHRLTTLGSQPTIKYAGS